MFGLRFDGCECPATALSGNSLRQVVRTHVHITQYKLVPMWYLAGEVTAGCGRDVVYIA